MFRSTDESIQQYFLHIFSVLLNWNCQQPRSQ